MIVLLTELLILAIFTGIIVYMALISYMVYRGCNYIPTPPKDIRRALSVLRRGDVFVDLGFGYGEVLEAALKRGASRIIGYELDPFRFLISSWRLRRYGKRVQLHFADIWSADLSRADVVFTFFTVAHMPKLYQKVHRELSKGSWFVSYVHEIAGVRPTKTKGKVRFFRM